MKEKLNSTVKKRESYRPYAPAIAVEIAEKYFGQDIRRAIENKSHPLYYMTSVVKAPKKSRIKYPSAVHFDMTARIQLLDKGLNPLMHSLSLAMEDSYGCGILLNTSLNLGYEALVGDPKSAVTTFSWTNFDSALFGDFAIELK